MYKYAKIRSVSPHLALQTTGKVFVLSGFRRTGAKPAQKEPTFVMKKPTTPASTRHCPEVNLFFLYVTSFMFFFFFSFIFPNFERKSRIHVADFRVSSLSRVCESYECKSRVCESYHISIVIDL